MRTDCLFVPATTRDVEAIASLLRSHSLPSEDFLKHLQHFIVARSGDGVLGCIGLEPAGKLGLLRSLAVHADVQNQGIASRLCRELEHQARATGIEELYLLTTTASDFFTKRGFQKRKRDEAPEWIRRNPQFTDLCPSTAVLMRKELNNNQG